MSTPIIVRVYRRETLGYSVTLSSSTEDTSSRVELGRQRPGEPAEFHFDETSNRLVISPINDKLVSRKHLLLSCVPFDGSNALEIRNLSKKRSINIEHHGKLAPEEATTRQLPATITFEDFSIVADYPRSEPLGDDGTLKTMSLGHQTLAPSPSKLASIKTSGLVRKGLETTVNQEELQADALQQYSSEQLVHWLSETMEVLQSAAGAPDFLVQAVDAVRRIVGLDAIAALRYAEGKWNLAAQIDVEGKSAEEFRNPSQTILNRVVESKQTIFQMPSDLTMGASLMGVKAVVASPILSPEGEVIGAIYGSRFGKGSVDLPQITKLEATMVEVIACGAAAGIAREQQQKRAMEMRIQFERCFPPQLIDELEQNPHMLDGQEAEISVLFCDVVGFSSISGRISSQLTLEWISDVMDKLAIAVLNNDGVVVDFIGDELMAMWGAPKEEPRHAEKACLAAADLMHCRKTIDDIWLEKIGQPIDFRIGICSGPASVGNTGSKRRLKYSPLGNTVNLASRLQSAAKQFGVKQLISESTASQLSTGHPALNCRPLGSARFVNIPKPVEIYELREASAAASAASLCQSFRSVIEACRSNELEDAKELLQKHRELFPGDMPSEMLAERIDSSDTFDCTCIWPLDRK